MKPRFSPLPYQVRADLFLHLATLEQAGVPVLKAWAMLKLPEPFQSRVDLTRRALNKGQDIARAGAVNGLWSELESALLKAAQNAGSPGPVYRRLAQYCQQKALAWAQIKSRMMLPAFLCVASLMIQPLPQLVAGTLSFAQYIWQLVREFGSIAILIGIGLFLHRQWQMSGVSPARMPIDNLLLQVPIFGKLHRRRNLCDFWQSLALLLESGVAMFEALPLALQTTSNGVIREKLAQILPQMQAGAVLSQTLRELDLPDQYGLPELVQTGEASGTLPEMLTRYANGEAENLMEAQRQLAAWLPRLVYVLVAVAMAYSIISSGAFSPHVPDKL
jgi:general secretion pathway protein F